MSDKSHVSLEQKVCQVCGKVYDSGAILLDTRIRNGKLMESMDKHTITGYGLCQEHQRLLDEGYIALVEATSTGNKTVLKPENANRTGRICHLRRSVADDIFNTILDKESPMVFVEPGVIDRLQAMQEESE